MILVIDIGNTTAAFSAVDNLKNTGAGKDGKQEPDVLFRFKLPVETGRDIDRFVAEALMLLEDSRKKYACTAKEDNKDPAIDLVAVSCVVPACAPAAEALAKKICARPPVFINVFCRTGLYYDRIPEPGTIGTDRLADSAWAALRYPLPVMTVDMGTATTINVIDRNRQFLGGMIAAGVNTSMRALGAGTAQLPQLSPRALTSQELIGRDTATTILSAAVIGTAAMIDGLAERVEEQLDSPVTLLLTGGNTRFVKEWVRHSFYYEPDLGAKGAAMIAAWTMQEEQEEDGSHGIWT